MQLLIVHSDPEMGEPLTRMVKDYTPHQCDLVASDSAAIEWARRQKQCDLLLTQLQDKNIDGLALGSSLSEISPALQVLFFPNYSASEQRLEVENTKVFPEPIEGDELLRAIEHAENAPPDAPDLFHVIDILQMCCLSRRSGALQLLKETKSGFVFLRHGKIVHAETNTLRGHDALAEMVRWKFVEFAYERIVRPPLETITQPWDEILTAIAGEPKRGNSLPSRQRSA
jgi:CheY-like chemotaxis protein